MVDEAGEGWEGGGEDGVDDMVLDIVILFCDSKVIVKNLLSRQNIRKKYSAPI